MPAGKVNPRFVLSAFCSAALLLFLTSCDSKRAYEENKEIPGGLWDVNSRVRFEFNIPDTAAYYNVFINVRNEGQYPYSNLYLFVSTVYPDGKTSRDTVNCILQDETGKWLGKGLGDLRDNRLLFKSSVHFPMSGKYVIEYEQAMRINPLPGIRDAGLRIERVQ